MAERKKPVRRGPTKAAALKALGLTKEDLDAIKELRERQVSKPEPEPREVTAEAVMHPASEERKRAWNEPDPDADPVWYVRNLTGVDVGFRLTRQKAQGERRTDLKPRGRRGDMVKLETADLKDPELSKQVGYGLVEVIPEGEALEAIKKQYTNATVEVPPHIAALRNERGEEYKTAPRTVSDEESMGYKVADLDPALMQGKLSDREIRRDGGFAPQNVVMEPVQSPRPGSIVSDGFMAPVQTDGSGASDEHAQKVDALARSKQFEGPGAGLGEVTVKVEPVQRVQ